MCSSFEQAKSDLRLKCDVVDEHGNVCDPGGHLDRTILHPLSPWGTKLSSTLTLCMCV
jgi:hypothetical protein